MQFSTEFSVDSIIQFVGLVCLMWGLYYTSKQIKYSAKINEDTLDWNKKTYTEDKLEQKPDPEIHLKLERLFGTLDSSRTIPLDDILAEAEKDPSVRINIRYKLNRYERLARGIRQGILDERIIRDALASHMMKDYLNYQNYVEHLQSSTPTGGLEEYSRLVLKWKRDGRFDSLFDNGAVERKQ